MLAGWRRRARPADPRARRRAARRAGRAGGAADRRRRRRSTSPRRPPASWLDRVAAHGLGARSAATIAVTDGGRRRWLRHGRARRLRPRPRPLRRRARATGIAGKVVPPDGLVGRHLAATASVDARHRLPAGVTPGDADRLVARRRAHRSRPRRRRRERRRDVAGATGGARPRGRPRLLAARAYGARRADLRRGRLRHRHDRLPGDADRPVVPPAGRRHDRAAHRQHRRQRRGHRVARASGSPATSCATPRGVPSNWRVAARARRRAASTQGVVGISGIDTRARHPAPARARRDAGRRSSRAPTPLSDGEQLADVVRAAPRWPAPTSPPRSPRRSRTSCPRSGSERFTVAALDLGIKAMTPRRPGRARHRGARAAGDRPPLGDVLATGRRRRVLLQRPGRPGGLRPARSRCCRRCCDARTARSSGSASATSCSAARSGSAPTSCGYGHRGINQPVLDRAPAGSRSPRTTTASPSTRRSTARRVADRLRPGRGQPRRPQRRRRRGPALPRPAGVLGAVPPGGGRRPARRRLPVRPVHVILMRSSEGGQLMPKRDDITHRPGHRLRADRHRPGRASSTTPARRPAGCCAPRACGSSSSTATRRRS